MRNYLYYLIAIVVLFISACNSNDAVAGHGMSSAPGNLSTQTPSDGAPRITVTELKEAVDKGTVLIIDARGPEAYEQEHIKGSINILEANLDSHIDSLPRDKMIVTYCS